MSGEAVSGRNGRENQHGEPGGCGHGRLVFSECLGFLRGRGSKEMH